MHDTIFFEQPWLTINKQQQKKKEKKKSCAAIAPMEVMSMMCLR